MTWNAITLVQPRDGGKRSASLVNLFSLVRYMCVYVCTTAKRIPEESVTMFSSLYFIPVRDVNEIMKNICVLLGVHVVF